MPSRTIGTNVGGGQVPGTNVPTLQDAIPGLDVLTKAATSNIGSQLSGMPSAGRARTDNAYFGINSGMPSSDFSKFRGADLYNDRSNQYQQQGFNNLLGLVGGYGGNVGTTAGQQQQQNQFNTGTGLQQQGLDLQSRGLDQNASQNNFQQWLQTQQLGLQGVNTMGNLLNSYMGFLN
jgi:hypothetical protein